MKTTRNLAILGFAVLSVWTSAPLAQGAMLAGSEPKEWPADPAKHVVTIKRVAQDDAGKKAIAAAEALLPAAAELLAAAKKDNPEAALKEHQWWYQEQLGIKIPFAITTDAIAYYSKLVSDYGKQTLRRYTEPGSHLTYHAAVSNQAKFELDGKTFENVTVVTLSLQFSQNFAATQTEGMSFEKHRTVVLDRDGKVLHVSGDGTTEVPIMAI